MKPNPFHRPQVSAIATLCGILSLAATPPSEGVVIDGNASTGDSYTALASPFIQVRESGFGNQNVLANLRHVQTGNTLNLVIAGRATNYAILLFIDAKAGGVNRITPNLIAPQPGGEEVHINKLALDADQGMTFETGFLPEMAIRIFGDEVDGVKHAYVDRYNLVTRTHTSAGDSHAGIVSDGPIRNLKTDWRDVGNGTGTNGYNTHKYGVEMALNLSALGVVGAAQTVKVSALLVSGLLSDDPEYDPYHLEGSNQVLGSLSTSSDMGRDVNLFNFQSESGTQTLSIPVDGLVPSGDQDGDGLLNGVETNTGIYVDANNTGTDPEKIDTDGDGYLDGLEVTGASGLGYISNPNLPNSTNIGVPGSFNLPTPWQPSSNSNNPGTAMSQESTSLTGQYRWILDYKFATSQFGALDFKFSTNGSLANAWGKGDSPGTIKRGGSDIPGYVSATGFHRFFFDQAALTYTFGRRVFANATAFLAAYALTSGSDFDGDGVSNENEFAANTDPTNPDSDQDGLNDLADPQPLSAVRDIVFRVNMHIQIVNGKFTPGVHVVKVSFFSSTSHLGDLALSDPDADDVYTGTLSAVEGPTGASFGDYRFFNSLEDVGYESNPIRTFALGPAHTPQILPVVFFNDDATSYAYDNWSDSFTSSPPGPPAADPDGDTFSNHQEFLFGTSPIVRTSSLAAMERTGDGLVIRWLERTGGASYRLEESATLAENPWPASSATITEDFTGVPENYVRKTATIPIDQPRKFIRVSGRE